MVEASTITFYVLGMPVLYATGNMHRLNIINKSANSLNAFVIAGILYRSSFISDRKLYWYIR